MFWMKFAEHYTVILTKIASFVQKRELFYSDFSVSSNFLLLNSMKRIEMSIKSKDYIDGL